MENIRKHRNIKLVNNEEEYLKNVMKPNFKSGTLLGPNLLMSSMAWVRRCYSEKSKNLNKLLVF